MSESCRICRKNLECFFESLFEYREGLQIFEIVMKVCPIVVCVGDFLPKNICDICLDIIISAYQLQRRSVESDKFFRGRDSDFPDNFVLIKLEQPENDDARSTRYSFDSDFACSESDTEEPATPTNLQWPFKFSFNPRIDPKYRLKPTNERLYQCNFCDVKLKPRFNIIRHMKLKHDSIRLPFGCRFCVARFDVESLRESHEENRHVNEKPSMIICDICGVGGMYEVGMKDHANDHAEFIGMKPLTNDEPSGKAKLRRNRFHPRPVTGTETLKYNDIWYSCNFCDRKMRPRKSLVRHIQHKHDPESLPFGCRFCIERFKTLDLHDRHVRVNHIDSDGQTTYFCEICGISGDNEVGMSHHKADDHDISSCTPLPTPLKELTITLPPAMRRKRKPMFHPRIVPGFECFPCDDVKYSCNFCHKKMRPRRSMMRHMKAKHDPNLLPFGCQFCSERLTIQEALAEHESESHIDVSPRTLFCDLCGVSGDNRIGMENHMIDDHSESIHKTPPPSTRVKLMTTNKYEQQRDTKKCGECGERFVDLVKLRYHKLLVHEKKYRPLEASEVEQELTCCGCSKSFSTVQKLVDHLRVHVDDYKFICLHCSLQPKSFETFEFHVKFHARPKTHECLQCHKRFPFGVKFFAHIKGHERMKTYRKISCSRCDRKFRSNKDLETHVKVQHYQETLFICPICAKTLSTEATLDSHIKFVHNKARAMKFECKFCDRKFSHKSKLTRHVTIHNSERPYVCELCSAAFKLRDVLDVHMKRHNGTLEKKYECNQCSVKFTSKHRQQQHLLTHTGEKPNQCNYCDNAYASKGDLIKHLQKAHVGHAVYRCEKCPAAFPRIVELREHVRVHADF